MAKLSNTESKNKFLALQKQFKNSLHGKTLDIEKILSSIISDKVISADDINECHRMVHTLVGSAGTFGAMTVSSVARELEQILKSQLNETRISESIKNEMSDYTKKLNILANDWTPTEISYPLNIEKKTKSKRSGNCVYVVDTNETFITNIVIQLEKKGLEIKIFNNLTSFTSVYDENIPSAIIINTDFVDDSTDGIDAINKIKKVKNNLPPVVFTSNKNNMQTRLAALSAGGNKYFCRPFNSNAIAKTVDSLIEREVKEIYKILLIDDDVELLNMYQKYMNSSGMEVKAVSDVVNVFDAVEAFGPDVIVLDLHLPEYHGTDVAQLIHQDDRWAMIPILFLSGESDSINQYSAISITGCNFIHKSINIKDLVSIVTTKAKQSRGDRELKNNLSDKIRENKFQIISSNIHNIVSETDVYGNILNVNDKFCEISGYSRQELIGQNHRILKSNYHTSYFYENLWKDISSGKIWHGTLCNYNKKGEEYWVESTIVPFLDEKGIPYKYVSARTDVTQVVRSEARFERSQIFANIGTWDWNIVTGKLYWSERIWYLFGYDKKLISTTYENFIAAIHEDDRELVTDAITNCVEKGDEYNIEHRVVWSDGSIHWLHERGDVVRDKDDIPQHMLGVVQDITLRKKAEHLLLEATEDAETANRAKSQFLSSMCHELRTPMNAIMGFGQLLTLELEQALTENQRESVNEILKASDHLLDLINEVLDLSRIEAGRIDLSIEDVNIGIIILESLQLILPLANIRNITVKLQRDEDELDISGLKDEKYLVRADFTRMKQVLVNLLSNAVKYNSENGFITIKYEQVDGNTRISVTDTGEGLNMEQQEKLFTAFNRLGAENTEIEGTGIGLVITKHIVDLMGGEIDFESNIGTGSTFWFELPSSTDGLIASENNNSTSEINIKISEERSVLYIEDNPANLRLVTQLLSNLPNLHMWSAHEPQLGLDLAKENNPDLILLDINLPGMDGFEVLKLLKQQEVTRNTPVIAISANAMPKDIEKGIDAGFDKYITKPININELLNTVEVILNKD